MNKVRIIIPGEEEGVRNYRNVLERLGAQVLVTEDMAVLDSVSVKEWDGLVIPGGADIDPARYGQKNTGCRRIDPVMDELQFTALDRFLAEGRPVLGICNGMQMINIRFGGTLIQDIPRKERHQHQNGKDSWHGARASSGSWMHALYGETLFINSAHHQAVDRMGRDLEAVLYSDDGIVEGIVHRKLPVYGLQWHPERMCVPGPEGYEMPAGAADGEKVYRHFIKICRR